MADNDLLVTISGAALSLLFYENVRSPGDQMGFLLGETVQFVVKTYTDSDNQVETVKMHINIETVVTCPLPDILHDSIGKINKEKLKDFIRDKSKQVIGWFRFRRNTGLIPTMRDKILHKQFASHFSGGNGSKEELFVTCLLSSSMSSTQGTHKSRHVFLRHRKGMFEPIPLRINNLGDDLSKQDGSDYKPTPATKSSDAPDVFTSLVESLNLDLTRTAGLESAITIQKAAEQYLNSLIPKVCESDLEVAELEKQVRELRTNVYLRNLTRKTKVNGSSNMVQQNYETQKNRDMEEERILQQNNPPRIDSPENICEDGRSLKDHSTSIAQTTVARKTRNTAASIAKSVSQEKSRRMGIEMDVQTGPQQDPFINAVSEMKVDIVETVSTRSRRSTGVSEIAKEPICKGEGNEIGVGRGRGKGAHEFNTGMKKARRTSGSVASRSNTERNSVSQSSEYMSSETNCVQSPSSLHVPYSQATKKNIDNTQSLSDSPDNH
ncbi:hypothetical protein KM043_006384 [Ampulex compressa]|nr:hypothetical protein KM043_006384 [Ampulex compressa]